MSIAFQQKLQTFFKQSFQVKRVIKELDVLRQYKQKIGYQTKYSMSKGINFNIFVQIAPSRLKEIKKLNFLLRLQFKIILKAQYPAQTPRLYFIFQNQVDVGLNPFLDYFKAVMPEWTPKITLIDIVKNVPQFIYKISQNILQNKGIQRRLQYFQADRLFCYGNCQSYPVKLLRTGTIYSGVLSIVNGVNIVLLEQTQFNNSFTATDFIQISELIGVYKHKIRHLGCMIEIKKQGKKYGVQLYSDQYQSIIQTLSDAIKAYMLISKQNSQEQISDQQQFQSQKQMQQFIITKQNIKQLESDITVMRSLVDTQPNSKNVKQLVQLLKKAVQYYSMIADDKCQTYLKILQQTMGDEVLQILLASEEDIQIKNKPAQYQSIMDFV